MPVFFKRNLTIIHSQEKKILRYLNLTYFETTDDIGQFQRLSG